MKLRYIFALLAACVLTLTGCSTDYEVDNLKGLQVSSSYVAIPVDGGSQTITVYNSGAWTVDTTGTVTDGTPWLEFSTLSGTGNGELTISAESTLDARTSSFKIVAGDETQIVNIIQGVSSYSIVPISEVLAGPENKTYRVQGTVTAIANTSYGNFYLDDGTGSLYIYGTVDESGSYNWDSFDIEVGDEVTVQGPKSVYNGTVELVDATFIEVEKSLIKVDSVENDTLPTAGGDVTVYLTCKTSNGIGATVPEDAQDWLSIKSINGNEVVYHATENTGAPRSTTLTFTTTDGTKTYSSQTTILQLGAAGSQALPFTVDEAIAYVNSVGGETSEVYVKGIVSKLVNDGFSSTYGNGTFYISTDGVYNDDQSKDLEIYRGLWLGNNKWTSDNAQIEVGAEVVIHGKLTLYKGTPETSSGNAYVFKVNGVSTETNGIGTLANPFNVAGAIEAANASISSNVYVNGTISKIANNGYFGATYGNGTFYISDDGTYHSDTSLDFEAYRVLWLGNQKWVEGDTQIAEGDKVTLCGKLTVYKGTAETSSGKAYVYSHNGTTE
jgi:acetyltransferase-like isoleucine patch superfamily enzyme